MATESEAGVKLPPGVGILTQNVVKSRPDLTDMVGFTVRVPRSLDIEANDGPQRVWVQGPNDSVVEEANPGNCFFHLGFGLTSGLYKRRTGI